MIIDICAVILSRFGIVETVKFFLNFTEASKYANELVYIQHQEFCKELDQEYSAACYPVYAAEEPDPAWIFYDNKESGIRVAVYEET